MTNRIQEHKIIAMQAIIFLSLLVMLSFILDGCAVKKDRIDRIEVEDHQLGYEFFKKELIVTLS